MALIATDGRIDWLPLPDLDSAPVFAALLDSEQGGFLSLEPVEEFTTERAYVERTNVLTTTFHTASGSCRVTDSLDSGVAGRLPWAELSRRMDGLSGTVRVRAMARPGTCLNTSSPWVQQTVHGAVLRADSLTIGIRTDNAHEVVAHERSVEAEYVTTDGSRHLFALVATSDEPLLLPSAKDIYGGIERTITSWRTWSDSVEWSGDWAEVVRRSALVLKLLLFSPTGAMVAAGTIALPESMAGGKNWDYRFAWVRDMAYSLTALFRFGLREEPQAAISWLLATIRRHGPDPLVFYRLDGTPPPDQPRTLDVPGWRGVGPVVMGNRAVEQLQLGVFGDLFSIVQLYVDHGNVLDAATGRQLANLADLACDQWRSRDAGMWELKTDRHYTTSKLGAWQALTNAVHLAEIGQIPSDPARWRSEADLIRDWVEANAWNEQLGAYVWYPGTDQLDASILLHAISGFDRGERMSRTLDALRARLGEGPHLYRYSGAREEEGAFVACSFWMVSALQLVGRTDEARALMTELIDVPNDVGLLAEMVDPATGEFLGNMPQALSHLALLNAAITLSEHAGGDATVTASAPQG